MKFTNHFGLPQILLRAARKNDAKYNKGNVHRSVTQLIQPPRIDLLRKKHFSEIEKDLSDEWWALLGSAVHHILEMGQGPGEITEERFFTTVDGWALSGACDLQELHDDESRTFSDYKVTTSFAVMSGEDGFKLEWEMQLNMLSFLAFKAKGIKTRSLKIIAIIRDWQRKQAELDPRYPQSPVHPIDIPLWPTVEQEKFLKERVAIHRGAEFATAIGSEPPECDAYERWVRGDKWIVQKEGNKKATKVVGSEMEAWDHIATIKKDQDLYKAVFRPGEPVRCKGNYCQVAAWCSQYQKEKADGISEERGDVGLDTDGE